MNVTLFRFTYMSKSKIFEKVILAIIFYVFTVAVIYISAYFSDIFMKASLIIRISWTVVVECLLYFVITLFNMFWEAIFESSEEDD